MSSTLPITVQILTFNSAKTLGRALKSVEQCTEIIVADGGSTDPTVAIAERAGAHVIDQPQKNGREITDFAAVRNALLKEGTQQWILVLDSDEWVSPELLEEVATIAKHRNMPTAYWMPRRYVLPDGRTVTRATTYPNERIYFFHRDAVVGWVKPVHERVQVKSETPILHLQGASLAPLGTLQEYKEKNERYLQIEAARNATKGWGHWFAHCVLHTLRSRTIALIKLPFLQLIPGGVRLPLQHELLRFWYGWRLIVLTCPPIAQKIVMK